MSNNAAITREKILNALLTRSKKPDHRRTMTLVELTHAASASAKTVSKHLDELVIAKLVTRVFVYNVVDRRGVRHGHFCYMLSGLDSLSVPE